jgi:hypothetical protein
MKSAKFSSKLLTVAIFGLWLFSMVLVFKESPGSARGIPAVSLGNAPEEDTETWMGIYSGGSKIGYAMQSFKETNLGYMLKEYTYLKAVLGGVEKEIMMYGHSVLDDSLAVKSFSFGLASGDYDTDLFGTVQDNLLEVELQTSQRHSKLTFPLKRKIYPVGVVPHLLVSQNFSQKKFSLPTFDPMSLSSGELSVAIEAEEETKFRGKKLLVYELSLSFMNVETRMKIDQCGNVLWQEEPGGMTMRWETKEEALEMPLEGGHAPDLLTQLAVKSNVDLPHPRELSYLKAELKNIEAANFQLGGDVQEVISAEPLIVEIDNQRRGNLSERTPTETETQPSALVQSEDLRIKRQAEKIAASENDPLKKAEKLCLWVFENVKKDFAVSIPSALEVLRVRKGDCNEHTTLFVALARSVGIPSKICVGLVYKEGYFYYHAWPEVWIGNDLKRGYWLPMDPTFGQTISDATHIKLLEGDLKKQVEIARVVGKLQVEVLDYDNHQESN